MIYNLFYEPMTFKLRALCLKMQLSVAKWYVQLGKFDNFVHLTS